MIFDTAEWKLISRHEPLRIPEIARLRFDIQESAMLAYALIMWGQAVQENYSHRITLPGVFLQ
jgi:hypothetical protein